MTHDSRAVANKILDIAAELGLPLTLMQLVKLVYLAHGWWLSLSDGEPLVDTQAQAWQYGPVHPQVYKAFKQSGRRPISHRAIDKASGLEYTADFSHEQESILTSVVTNYGSKHAYALSDIMHRPGTPWSKAVENNEGQFYGEIKDELIKEHFDGLR